MTTSRRFTEKMRPWNEIKKSIEDEKQKRSSPVQAHHHADHPSGQTLVRTSSSSQSLVGRTHSRSSYIADGAEMGAIASSSAVAPSNGLGTIPDERERDDRSAMQGSIDDSPGVGDGGPARPSVSASAEIDLSPGGRSTGESSISSRKFGGLFQKTGPDYVKDMFREEKRRFTVMNDSRFKDTQLKSFDARMLGLSNALWPIYDVDGKHQLDGRKLERLVSHYMRQYKEYIPRFWSRHYFAHVDKAVHDKHIPEESRKRLALEWNDTKTRAVKAFLHDCGEYLDRVEHHTHKWMALLDINHDGVISKDEFTRGFLACTDALAIDLDGSIRVYGLDDKVRAMLNQVDVALGRPLGTSHAHVPAPVASPPTGRSKARTVIDSSMPAKQKTRRSSMSDARVGEARPALNLFIHDEPVQPIPTQAIPDTTSPSLHRPQSH